MDPEFAKKSDLNEALFFLLFLLKTHREDTTFYRCTSVVSVYMTPYRLEILWRSWILMEVEELFGCWSLLLSAVEQPGISYKDQKMTKGGLWSVWTGTSSSDDTVLSIINDARLSGQRR